MHTHSPDRTKAPYGLAFPVHELVFIRAWAEKRGLSMKVMLDQVLEGAEFEEMLLVRGLVPSHQSPSHGSPSHGSPARGSLSLWRVSGGAVVTQAQGGQPRVFGGVHAALSHAGAMFTLKPSRVTSAWRRLLGMGPR